MSETRYRIHDRFQSWKKKEEIFSEIPEIRENFHEIIFPPLADILFTK